MNRFVKQPKTKRGEVTLERIVKAGEECFLKKGYHGSSINDITSTADVAPGTFYIYFEDKLSLYKHLLVHYSHDIRKYIALRLKETGATTRKEAERVGLRAFLEYIQEHKSMYNIIWESLYIDKKLFIDYYSEFGKNYARHIQEAIGEGQLKPYNAEVVAYMLMGISNFIGLNYVMFKETDNFDPIVDEVIEILDKGLF
jgi:AcrR family transcriptional regulator